MEYAGFWRRFAAFNIDAVLLGMVQAVATIVMVVTIPEPEASDEANVGSIATANLVSFVATWLYFALMESSAKQATVGKILVGVVVTDIDGNRVSFGRASGRYFGKIVSWIILAIGFIMAAFTERKQALHDIMAGCLVIRKPKSA